jgi:hypothetical protein
MQAGKTINLTTVPREGKTVIDSDSVKGETDEIIAGGNKYQKTVEPPAAEGIEN